MRPRHSILVALVLTISLAVTGIAARAGAAETIQLDVFLPQRRGDLIEALKLLQSIVNRPAAAATGLALTPKMYRRSDDFAARLFQESPLILCDSDWYIEHARPAGYRAVAVGAHRGRVLEPFVLVTRADEASSSPLDLLDGPLTMASGLLPKHAQDWLGAALFGGIRPAEGAFQINPVADARSALVALRMGAGKVALLPESTFGRLAQRTAEYHIAFRTLAVPLPVLAVSADGPDRERLLAIFTSLSSSIRKALEEGLGIDEFVASQGAFEQLAAFTQAYDARRAGDRPVWLIPAPAQPEDLPPMSMFGVAPPP